MTEEQGTGAGAARKALLGYLQREWPDSVDIVAQVVLPGVSDIDFLEACTSLQHEGLIMYEALLLGVKSSPELLAAAVTRKGQQVVAQK